MSKNVGFDAFSRAISTEVSAEPPALRVFNANRSKETLLRSYYLRHSFDSFDPMLVNFIIERLGASMAELGAAGSTVPGHQPPIQEILRSTLILCGTGLRTQAKSYHVCNLAYYGLQSQMRSEDLRLLLTYAKPPDKSDMPPLGHDAVTSWPLPIISMSDDPKKAALSKMVRDYEASKARIDSGATPSQACPLSVICN